MQNKHNETVGALQSLDARCDAFEQPPPPPELPPFLVFVVADVDDPFWQTQPVQESGYFRRAVVIDNGALYPGTMLAQGQWAKYGPDPTIRDVDGTNPRESGRYASPDGLHLRLNQECPPDWDGAIVIDIEGDMEDNLLGWKADGSLDPNPQSLSLLSYMRILEDVARLRPRARIMIDSLPQGLLGQASQIDCDKNAYRILPLFDLARARGWYACSNIYSNWPMLPWPNGQSDADVCTVARAVESMRGDASLVAPTLCHVWLEGACKPDGTPLPDRLRGVPDDHWLEKIGTCLMHGVGSLNWWGISADTNRGKTGDPAVVAEAKKYGWSDVPAFVTRRQHRFAALLANRLNDPFGNAGSFAVPPLQA